MEEKSDLNNWSEPCVLVYFNNFKIIFWNKKLKNFQKNPNHIDSSYVFMFAFYKYLLL